MKQLFVPALLLAALSTSAQIAEVGAPVQVSPAAAQKAVALTKSTPAEISVEADVIFLTVANGQPQAIHPVDCPGYVWPSLSPDGTKLMFVAAGKGIYITDLQGNVLSTPGNFEEPVWVGNSVIAAMEATDDGHQLRSARIVLIREDGSEIQAVTSPESMTMLPQASADGSTLVYSTIDGVCYQVSLSIH